MVGVPVKSQYLPLVAIAHREEVLALSHNALAKQVLS
jgi:hypothetical protein